MPAGRPPIFKSADELQKGVDEYLESTPSEKYTITGLALSLGFESRQSFYDYEEKAEYSYIIKRARLFVECSYEHKLSGNNSTGSIFALKNMGWKDKSEVEQSGGLTMNWHEEKTYNTK